MKRNWKVNSIVKPFFHCPTCQVRLTVHRGQRSELNYYRVMMLGKTEKLFFCNEKCYEQIVLAQDELSETSEKV